MTVIVEDHGYPLIWFGGAGGTGDIVTPDPRRVTLPARWHGTPQAHPVTYAAVRRSLVRALAIVGRELVRMFGGQPRVLRAIRHPERHLR